MSLAYFSYDFSYYLFVRNISYLFEGGIKNDEGSFEESSMKYKRPILLHKKNEWKKLNGNLETLNEGGIVFTNSIGVLLVGPLASEFAKIGSLLKEESMALDKSMIQMTMIRSPSISTAYHPMKIEILDFVISCI